MCNWRKWFFPGLLAVVILTALSTWFRTEPVQNDLSAKALEALEAEHPWATVELDGRDLTLRGTAPSQAAADGALTLAENAYDVRVAQRNTQLLAAASPYILSGKLEGDTLVLTGNVPDEETRARILQSAQTAAPNAEIDDQMTLARGAPDNYGDLADFTLGSLAGLSSGAASLTDAEFDIEGISVDSDSYEAAIARLAGDVPEGSRIARAEIAAPVVSPYEWTAEMDNETIRLSGSVPSASLRDDIRTQTQSDFPQAQIVNDMQIASGEPEAYGSAVEYSRNILSSLEAGKASLVDDKLTITGTAKTPEDYDVAIATLANAPAGVQVSGTINPASVDPYVFQINKLENEAVVSGFAPDRQTADGTIAMVKDKLGTDNVRDELRIANGQPEIFPAARERVAELLARTQTGQAELRGNVARVTGQMETQASLEALENETIEGFETAYNLSTDEPPIPTAEPYLWRLVKPTEGPLVVSGNAPDEDAKLRALEMAKSTLSIADATDEQTIALGAPRGFSEAQNFVAGQIKLLEAGEGTISNRTITISGESKNKNLKRLIERTAPRRVPQGFQVGTNITAPEPEVIRPDPNPGPTVPTADPYEWRLVKPEGGTVTISGFAPDDASKDSVAEMVGTTIDAEIVDEQTIALGIPDKFKDAQTLITSQLKLLESGEGSITNRSISISGAAKNQNLKSLIERSANRRAPEGYELATNITAPEPEVIRPDPIPEPEPEVAAEPEPAPAPVAQNCRAFVVTLLRSSPLRFDTNRAIIKSGSKDTLDKVAEQLRQCPDVRFEVGGHTDSRGRDEFNQKLSEARANAVTKYLSEKGVEATRFEAKGYGETKPVATNDTEDGRSLNRRIEFNVIQ